MKGKQNTKKTIHIVDSSIEMHGNYARNKLRAVSSSGNPVRANGGKPIAVGTSINTRRSVMVGDR